jgi:3alpha(or 20beta)-hydroxysteroid dehydrogenase
MNQVVLVSGGAGALGRVIAEAIVREGGRAVLADVDPAGADTAAALGDSAGFVLCDVTDPHAWETAVQDAAGRFGPVTALVNNAGTTSVHRVEDLTPTEMVELAEINQFAIVYGMQAVFAGMRSAGAGSIVNVTSISAGYGVGFNVGYAAAKGAVRAITLCAAVEWAPHGIRVNTIVPGTIDTPMARGGKYARLSNLEERVRAQVPLGRPGTPEEVAAMTVFLISDESAFSTGSEFVLDGGQTAGHLRTLSA